MFNIIWRLLKKIKNFMMLKWIKGEKFGEIEELDREENGYVYFKSGNRIAKDEFKNYLQEYNEDESNIVLENPVESTKYFETYNVPNLPIIKSNENILDVSIEKMMTYLEKSKKTKIIKLKVKLLDKNVLDFLTSIYDVEKMNIELRKLYLESLKKELIKEIDFLLNE